MFEGIMKEKRYNTICLVNKIAILEHSPTDQLLVNNSNGCKIHIVIALAKLFLLLKWGYFANRYGTWAHICLFRRCLESFSSLSQ